MKTLPNDISRCANNTCKLKCLRKIDFREFMEKPPVFSITKFEPKRGKCDYQIKN